MRRGPHTDRGIAWPRASLWQLFSHALSALLLLWLPFALLRQLDAFIAFRTASELGSDLALAAVLIGLQCLLLAVLGLTLRGLLALVPAGRRWADPAAWALVLIPCAWVCLWQLGGSSWAWFKLTAGADVSLTPHARITVTLLLLLVLGWGMWKGMAHRIAGPLLNMLQSIRSLALILLVTAAGATAWHPPRLLQPASPVRPASTPTAVKDIFLITIDTLAERDAQVCASGDTLMPHLRKFAAQATCFSRAYSSANFTTPSTITLETGALPWHHWGVQIVAKAATPLQQGSLAPALRQAGYRTLSFSANILASPRHHGTDPGYDDQRILGSTALGSQPRVLLTRFPDTTLPFWLSSLVPFLDTLDVYLHGATHPYPPQLTYEPALAAIGERGSSFAWVHTLPPHDPFLPPASTKGRLLPGDELGKWSQQLGMTAFTEAQQGLVNKHRLRYREGIMGADEALGQFLTQLEQAGRLDDALVIVTSDHGESFAHGYMGHAGDILTDDVLRVPLLIKLPRQRQARVVDQPVSLADVAPTIADLGGAPPLPYQDGRSLRPALFGEPFPPQPVFAMAMERQSRFAPLQRGRYVVVDGLLKLVLDKGKGSTQLFELGSDPDELHDLSAARPQDTARLGQVLDERLREAEARRQRLFPR
ncbi:sulfatase [Roseateles sp. DB2]|uniref:sulfatase n=1 Tax=Roseateles sp. DB2 TaxID=3453717 RepID=UPI003EEA83D7